MSADEALAARRAARAAWPVRRFALGDEPGDDFASVAPGERVAMVWQLTLDAWATRGGTEPGYRRHEAPGRVIRRT